MKDIVAFTALVLAQTLALPFSVQAQELAPPEKPQAEVVETNEQGQATRVRIGETLYYICIGERQDSCINPRDAGLNFGNREIDYWPGKPASEFDGPVPPKSEFVQESAGEVEQDEADEGE